MAAGWAGDDEGVSIKITSDANVAEALKAVRELDARLSKLGETLKKVASQGNKGLYSAFNNKQIDAANDRLKTQIDLVSKLGKASDQEAKSAAKVAAALSKEAKAVEAITNQYKKAAKEKEAFTKGDFSNREKLKSWQKGMASTGTPIVGNPKSIEMAANNMRSLRESMKSAQKAGIANVGTLNALETGAASAFSRGFTVSEKFRLGLGVLKKDLHSLFKTMELGAKNMQWTGMQMMQGMTLPIIGLGVVATSEFDKFNKQMFQLKKVTEFSEDYDLFRDKIELIRKEFGLMPSVVAGAFKDIAALGITGADNIEAWVREISKITVLGDIDMAGATEFIRSVNTLFGQDLGAQLGISSIEATALIMADLNAISDETSVQLGDLAEAFPKVAPVMKALNFNASETAASIAAMHTAGIDASEGAVALKTAMYRVFAGVGKGKETLDKLGISMYDANGNVVQGTEAMLRLGEALDKLNDKGQMEAMYDLVGIHQGARTQAYWDDMLKGYREYKDAMANDGLISQEEYDKFTSGWVRAMGAAGEIKVDFDMTNMERYQKAQEKYMEDPSKALAQFKSDMTMFMVTLGELILPSLIEWQESFMAFLDRINAMPAAIKKGIVVVALMAAAMGPLIYATAQAGLAISTFGRVATKVLPSTYKDITQATARKLLDEDPNRADIGQVGNRVVQFKNQRRMTADMKILTAAQYEAAEAAGVLEYSSKEAADAIDDIGDEASQTSKKLDMFQAKMYGSSTAANQKRGDALRRNIEGYKKNLALLDDPNFTSAGMNAGVRAKNIDKTKDSLKKAMREFSDLGDKAYVDGQIFGRNYINGISSFMARFKSVGILGLMKGKAGGVRQSISNMPMLEGINIYERQMKRVHAETAKSIGGIRGQLLGVGKAGAIGFGGAASSAMGLLLKLGAIGAAIAGIAAVGAVLYMAFSNIEGAGEALKKSLQPAFDSVKRSVQYLILTFQEIISIMGGIIGGFDDSADSVDKAQGAIDALSTGIAVAVEFFGRAIRAVADLMTLLRPMWEGLAYMIKNLIGFVTAAANGDWRNAMMYFAAFAYEGIRPIIIGFEFLLDAVITTVKGIMNIVGLAGQAIAEFIAFSTLGFVDFTDQVASGRDAMSGFFDGLTDKSMVKYFDDNLRTLGSAFGQSSTGIGLDIGKHIGDGVADGIPKGAQGNDIGEKLAEDIQEGVDDANGGKGLDISEFLGKVKSNLDEQIAKLRDSVMKSLESAHKQEMAAYDAKLQAIDDVEKAEEKLYAEQAYIQSKRELLYRRSIDVENYQRDRALAIYEGRTDDARMLDLEHKKNTHDFNKEMGDLEEQRRREIVKQQREEEREIIGKQKSIAEERYEVARDGLERELAEVTKYTPRNMAEMNNMLGQMSAVMKKYHIDDIPMTVQTGVDMWSTAISDANDQMIHDFAWSGETAVTAWLAAFIRPDVMAVLIARATEMKDGVNGEMDKIAPMSPEDILPPSTIDQAKEGWEGMLDGFKGAFDGFMDGTTIKADLGFNSLGESWDNCVYRFWDGIERIKLWFSGLGWSLYGVLDNMGDVIVRLFSWIGSVISSIGEGVVNNMIKAYNWLAGLPGADKLGLNKKDGVDFNGDGNKWGYAAGGITSGPTLAGEGSNPREYVIPTDRRYRSNALSLTSSLISELGVGGTHKMPRTNSASISGSISKIGASAAAGAGTTIYVENFIGEEEWFKQLAERHDMKVNKKKANNSGSAKRVVSKYNQNNRGSY